MFVPSWGPMGRAGDSPGGERRREITREGDRRKGGDRQRKRGEINSMKGENTEKSDSGRTCASMGVLCQLISHPFLATRVLGEEGIVIPLGPLPQHGKHQDSFTLSSPGRRVSWHSGGLARLPSPHPCLWSQFKPLRYAERGPQAELLPGNSTGPSDREALRTQWAQAHLQACGRLHGGVWGLSSSHRRGPHGYRPLDCIQSLLCPCPISSLEMPASPSTLRSSLFSKLKASSCFGKQTIRRSQRRGLCCRSPGKAFRHVAVPCPAPRTPDSHQWSSP